MIGTGFFANFRRCVLGLVAVCWLAWFGFGCFWQADDFSTTTLSAATLGRLGALSLPLQNRLDWLRIFTMWLVHVDLIHLLGNVSAMCWLAWCWPQKRSLIGPFLGGIVAAGGASWLAYHQAATLCCGGSGVLLALSPSVFVGSVGWFRRLGTGVCVLSLWTGMAWSSADVASHVGGFLSGCVWIVRRKATA